MAKKVRKSRKITVTLEFDVDLEIGDINDFLSEHLLNGQIKISELHPQIKLARVTGSVNTA